MRDAPDVVSAIHRDYADAGAVVHTAATFRTRRTDVGAGWEAWTRRAVALARGAVPPGHRVFGSVAPVEDCYRPERSPPDAEDRHREFAAFLAPDVDGLLCEAFPSVAEGLAAARAAVATGRPTWLAFTAGPNADLLRPADIADGALRARDVGVDVVLVNCTRAADTDRFVAAIAATGVPFGAYANVAPGDVGTDPADYAALAARWLDRGAVVVGGCCGTGPAHVRALAAMLAARDEGRGLS